MPIKKAMYNVIVTQTVIIYRTGKRYSQTGFKKLELPLM